MRQTGERRVVTALFADISGFTSLAERLDEDDLHGIIAPLIARMAAIGERYGGSVAKYAGDALLVFFGAPVAHEDHAARALLTALALHDELGRSRQELGPAAAGLTLHVGVNTGPVVAGMFGGDERADYSILGDAVNLAQRLEASAPSGETYVGETTWRETAERFDLEPVGELTVKGKREPVPAWRLTAERAPDLGPGATGAPFVGRRKELDAARAVVAAAAAGAGGILAVVGEPGVGKSRLSEAIAADAAARGVSWLVTRCISYGAGVAYFPVLELVRRRVGIGLADAPDEAIRRLEAAPEIRAVPGAAAHFARVLGLPAPVDGPGLDGVDPEAFRAGFHRVVLDWLSHLAERSPAVLSVEDVHWLDAATSSLLEEIAEAVASGRLPICLHLTARPEAGEMVRALAGGRAEVLTLGPLRPLEVGEVAAGLLGAPLAAGLRGLVVERTGGNPFFVRELLRALTEADAIEETPAGWDVRADRDVEHVPTTVQGVVGARIDRLPAPAARLLQIAAAIGRRVALPLLQEVAGDVVDPLGALRRLVDGGFLEPLGEAGGEAVYGFHHALVLDVAYERMLRRDRRELHRRIAQAAEELYGSGDEVLDLLARHLHLAQAGVKAFEILTRAAARSRRLFANAEAMEHLRRAADLASVHPRVAGRRAGVLLELADVEELCGRYDAAYAHYAEARDAGEPRAWRGMAAVLRTRGECEAALELVDEAFATGAGADHAAPLWLERAWALVVDSRFEEAIAAARAGLDAAAEGDRCRPLLLVQLLRAESAIGRLDEALAHGEEAYTAFDRLDDLRGQVTATRAIGGVQIHLHRYDEAARTLRRGLLLAEHVGAVEEIAACLVNLAIAEMERGDLEAAIACDRRALEELERVGHATGLAIASVNLADKLARVGELEEAADRCRRGLDLATANGDDTTVAEALDTGAVIALQAGRPQEAVAGAERAAELFAALGAGEQAARARATAEEARRVQRGSLRAS